MSSLKEQTDAKIEAGRKNNPEFMKGVDDIINQAKALQQGDNALKIGQIAPNFELPNYDGKLISLNNLLKDGPVVVVFYRGNWCPYCNLQLRALQVKLNEFKKLGATLIAISAQVPDKSVSKDKINEIEFPATFIIGTDNTIQWNYVNIDYRTRSEPEEIIQALKKIS